MELVLHTERDADVCTLTLQGEVDVYTAPQLRQELASIIDGGCSRIVIDLEKVSFIDSSALGVLVGALGRAREKGGSIRIVCTRDNILKLFTITGLDAVFPIFSERASAVRF